MSRFLAAILFGSAMLMEAQPAKAEWKWAHEYLDACEPSSPDWQICAAYIRGYLGAINHAVANKRTKSPFCLPEGISTEEVARTFRDFTAKASFVSVFAMEGALDNALGVTFQCRVS